MQNFQIVLLWCAVLLAVGASLFFYGLLTLLERAAYVEVRLMRPSSARCCSASSRTTGACCCC